MKKTTALVKWDEELAKAAASAVEQEANAGGGQFFSIRGGTLKLADAPLPNNEAFVVIVDSVLENTFFTGDFDPESPSTPDCYAFGRDEKTLTPHEAAKGKQCATCAECPNNKFGSSEKGRGKACRNRRRLACVPAGTVQANGFQPFSDPEQLKSASVVFLALPPTSINGWASYVKQVAGALRRPPHGVITKIKVVPDVKTQLKVTFELVGPLPDALVPAAIAQNQVARDTIIFPYPEREESAPKARRGKRKF